MAVRSWRDDAPKGESALLPATNRLHKDRDINRVYQKGRSARSDLFRLSWLPSRGTQPRIAVVTSRKLSTKAVRRNLLKRQTRGIVKELLPRLQAIDLVVQILPTIIGQAAPKRRDDARKVAQALLGYDRLKTDLCALLERSRLITKI